MLRRKERPVACSRCNSSHTAQVVWDCVYLNRQDQEEVARGTVIIANPQVALRYEPWQMLMKANVGKLPSWVCLDCNPGWAEVSWLGIRNYHQQLEKETAVSESDFERAYEIQVAQDHESRQMVALVAELLNQTRTEI